MLGDDPSPKSAWPSVVDKHSGATAFRSGHTPGQARLTSGDLQNKKADARSSASHLPLKKDSYGGSDTQNPSQSGQVLARKRRVHAQVSNSLIVIS